MNMAPSPGPVSLPPAQGLMRVTIQGSIMTSTMIVPTLIVDGYKIGSQYGINQVPVTAGRHQVELYAQWMRRYGQAAMVVDVPAGGVVDVFYAAPWHQFTTGSIGLTKQPRKGVWMLLVLFAVLIAVFLPLVVLGAMY